MPQVNCCSPSQASDDLVQLPASAVCTGMRVSTGFAVAVAICVLGTWAPSAGAASMVAQSAVGRPYASGCDPCKHAP